MRLLIAAWRQALTEVRRFLYDYSLDPEAAKTAVMGAQYRPIDWKATKNSIPHGQPVGQLAGYKFCKGAWGLICLVVCSCILVPLACCWWCRSGTDSSKKECCEVTHEDERQPVLGSVNEGDITIDIGGFPKPIKQPATALTIATAYASHLFNLQFAEFVRQCRGRDAAVTDKTRTSALDFGEFIKDFEIDWNALSGQQNLWLCNWCHKVDTEESCNCNEGTGVINGAAQSQFQLSKLPAQMSTSKILREFFCKGNSGVRIQKPELLKLIKCELKIRLDELASKQATQRMHAGGQHFAKVSSDAAMIQSG